MMTAMWVRSETWGRRTLTALAQRLVRQEGQGMVEYGLIIALVAVGLIAGLGLMSNQIGAVFTNITTSLTGAATPAP